MKKKWCFVIIWNIKWDLYLCFVQIVNTPASYDNYNKKDLKTQSTNGDWKHNLYVRKNLAIHKIPTELLYICIRYIQDPSTPKNPDKYGKKWGFEATIHFRGFGCTIHILRNIPSLCLEIVGGCCFVKYEVLKFIIIHFFQTRI